MRGLWFVIQSLGQVGFFDGEDLSLLLSHHPLSSPPFGHETDGGRPRNRTSSV